MRILQFTWSSHENMIYTGINAQNLYVLAKMFMSRLPTDNERTTECEDKARILETEFAMN